MKKVKAPKGADPGDKINPLNEEQAYSFLEQAKNDRHYRLWLTFLGTGCRPEELLALNKMRVNFRNKTITICEVVICDKKGKMVPKPIPKSKKSRRTIMISDAIVDAIKLHLEEQDAWKEKIGPKLYKDKGLVFASETGGYLNPSNLASRHFKPILRAAGLPDIRPYDLRHSHATLLFLQCRDMELVSKRLGHDDVAFTWKTYYHLLPGVEEEAVAKFDGVLTGKLLVPEPQPDKASEDAPGDACVNSCVTNNVITFPTGALPKKRTRNCMRDKASKWS